MRMWTISDLHLEGGYPFTSSPPEGFDVLVCAGDVREGDPAGCVLDVARLSAGKPAVLVLGNHDIWGLSAEEALELAREASVGTGVHVLQDDSVMLDGVRFHGATLWTDGLLNQPVTVGGDWFGGAPGGRATAFHPALPFGEPVHVRGPGIDRRAKGRDILAWHARSVGLIERELDDAAAGGPPLVVVTHHGPTPLVLTPERQGASGSAMSVSDLGHLVECGAASAWVHGHVHLTCDLVPGYGTRLVCNARGGRHAPNPLFEPGLVIDVPGIPVPRPSL